MEVRTGKGSQSNDVGFQDDSQTDDLGVNIHLKMASRRVKMASRGGPGGVREASGLQEAPRGDFGARLGGFGAASGPQLGPQDGPMLAYVGPFLAIS